MDGKAVLKHIISIHAPREGSDTINGKAVKEYTKISIHAPREGSDLFTALGL